MEKFIEGAVTIINPQQCGYGQGGTFKHNFNAAIPAPEIIRRAELPNDAIAKFIFCQVDDCFDLLPLNFSPFPISNCLPQIVDHAQATGHQVKVVIS